MSPEEERTSDEPSPPDFQNNDVVELPRPKRNEQDVTYHRPQV